MGQIWPCKDEQNTINTFLRSDSWSSTAVFSSTNPSFCTVSVATSMKFTTSALALSAAILQITSFGVVNSAPLIGQLIGAAKDVACVPVGIIPVIGQVACPSNHRPARPHRPHHHHHHHRPHRPRPVPVPVPVVPIPKPESKPDPKPEPTTTTEKEPNPTSSLPSVDTSKYTSELLKNNPEMIAIAENDTTFTINPQTQAAIAKFATEIGDATAGFVSIPKGTNRDRYEAFHRLVEITDNANRLDDNPEDTAAFEMIREWFARAQGNYPNSV
ncbi:hypothetical protein H4219_005984 [Mycoemilia scoparia]|uniref:Uncharacterized protein n=1 Tax=Mycoemilia scoparia TaxID=417184 RepID=A0A9W7ZM63_9FUNG|nr:hypothetical protein H4219_005984 [Mycoemilia scoparia]